MNNEEIFIYTFESHCNSGLTIFDIECAYRNGKDILDKIKVKVPIEDLEKIDYYLNDHKNVIPEHLFEVIETRKSRVAFENFEYIFHYKDDSWVNKLKPVSKEFISFLNSQNIFKKISNQIPLNNHFIEEHLILILRGVFCDDNQGYLDCVIYGAKTPLMLTWNNISDASNVYPADISFNEKLLVFNIPDFDPTDFINYVKGLKNKPKYFKDIKTNYKIRENLYTHGESHFEFKIKLNQKSKDLVERMIDKIKGFIEKRIADSDIEEHLKEYYLRYFNFKDIKADSFTLELDLGSADIKEIHSILYLLDEGNIVKSVSIALV